MLAESVRPCVAPSDELQIATHGNSLQVWMYDPWCRTPWYTAALSRALLDDHVQLRLVYPRYHLEPQYFKEEGLITRPGPVDLASLGTSASALRRIGRIAEYVVNTATLAINAATRPPDILHQQQCVLLEHGLDIELGFLQWCRRRGTRVVHTVHNLLPHAEKPFHSKLYARLYDLSDALICHSSEAAQDLETRFEIDPQKIHIVPHGPLFCNAPLLTREECRSSLNLPLDRQVMLSHGVIRGYKGIDILLRAWAQFLANWRGGQPPLLLIAGQGSEKEIDELRREAAFLGLTSSDIRMDFHYMAARDVPLYYGAADVLLYPYRKITTSGALQTGLNYCKPIIASDLPSFREYLRHGQNALLVAAENVDSLSASLSALGTNQTMLRQLIEGSRRNQNLQAQWPEIARRTTAVYREIASQLPTFTSIHA